MTQQVVCSASRNTVACRIGSVNNLHFGFPANRQFNNKSTKKTYENSKLGIASAVLNLARVTGSILGTAIMLLLVSVIIGEAQIRPEQSLKLLAVIRWSLSASCLLAILGAYFSYARGLVYNS